MAFGSIREPFVQPVFELRQPAIEVSGQLFIEPHCQALLDLRQFLVQTPGQLLIESHRQPILSAADLGPDDVGQHFPQVLELRLHLSGPLGGHDLP